ncbi:MAG: hypothetical protein KJT03_18010, partial [Verrucomicrobiae bacterium]|nr:hypothetical protein [Verrucomicrobiae bacterium]
MARAMAMSEESYSSSRKSSGSSGASANSSPTSKSGVGDWIFIFGSGRHSLIRVSPRISTLAAAYAACGRTSRMI